MRATNEKTEQTMTDAVPCPFCGSTEGFYVEEGITPSWRVFSCRKCGEVTEVSNLRAQLEGLMRMLGAHTHAVKAPDGVECANCINEEKAKGEPS